MAYKEIEILREQYNTLDKSLGLVYEGLIRKVTLLGKEGIYFCDDEFIKEDIEETLGDIQNLGDVQELPALYYNNYNGVEKLGYLLHFDQHGITVIDNEDYELTGIQLKDLNGVFEKLSVLEYIGLQLK